jgi:hypothetical protein
MSRYELILIAVLGFVAGALRATNTWDFPTMLIVGVIAILVGEITRHLRLPLPDLLDQRLAFLFRRLVAIGWRSTLFVAVAVVSFTLRQIRDSIWRAPVVDG